MSLRRKIIGLIVLTTVSVGVWLTWRATRDAGRRATFHIAFNEWVGFAPFFLARELGYFGDLPVEFHFVAVEGDKRAGLYADRFQMICETTDMFQSTRESNGFPGRIVFATDESHGGDGVVASDKVKRLSDLRGKAVVAEPGQPAHFALQYLLSKEGLKLQDLQIQQMNSPDAAAAFMAGRADVAGTYEPYLTQALQKRPGSHLLVSSKDLPGLIVDVAIVKDEILTRRRKDVESVYLGWGRAVSYFETHHPEAVVIMAKSFKLSPNEFEDTIGGLRYLNFAANHQYFGQSGRKGPIFEIFATINRILRENELTSAVISAESRIDVSIVNAVHSPEPAH